MGSGVDIHCKHGTNPTGRKRKEWRLVILAVLDELDAGATAGALWIAQRAALRNDEPQACSTRGAFYDALRSLADDGLIIRTEYCPDGYRRNVAYSLRRAENKQKTLLVH